MRSTASNPLRRADVWALVVILLVSAAAVVWLVPRNRNSVTAAHSSAAAPTSPSMATTPSSASSGAKRPDTHAIILAHLRPFLSGFFTIAAHETAAVRTARVQHLAPASVLSGVEITLPGIPAGTVMTPQLSPGDNVQFQTPKGQVYVIYEVPVKLSASTHRLVYLTGSVWVQRHNRWVMVHFAYNPDGVYEP